MEFRLILATIFILTKQPKSSPSSTLSLLHTRGQNGEQLPVWLPPRSLLVLSGAARFFLTRERKLSDQPTNGTDIAGSMGSLPATATRCPDTFSAKEMVSPSLRGIFQRLLAVGPSLVGSIVFLIGRDTRVSLTFRKTLAGPCSCPFPEFCSRTKYSRLKSQTKNQFDQTISPKYNQPL